MEKSGSTKFIALMALLMSFIALSIDAMLPALGTIGRELGVQNPKDVQYIITFIFFGMGFGLLIFGPLSDSYGRKFSLSIGIVIYSIGCVFSFFANNMELMLLGRFLQGFGGASCRVVTLSMIRDKFDGNEMAKVMSFIMIFFIMVPALAPTLGQGILLFAGWRTIFGFLFVSAILAMAWMLISQEETLLKEKRHPFNFETISRGVKETLKNRISRGYMIVSGLMFGAFISYLGISQPLLQEKYELGKMFSVVFGGLALSIGCSSYINGKCIGTFGMENLCKIALRVMITVAFVFIPVLHVYDGLPPLWLLLPYLSITFLCFGVLFSNFNTLAIQPLGHIAGLANSVISSIQTLISTVIGGVAGFLYDGTVNYMVGSFLLFGIISLIMLMRLNPEPVPEEVEVEVELENINLHP